jgi:hypothetical protein
MGLQFHTFPPTARPFFGVALEVEFHHQSLFRTKDSVIPALVLKCLRYLL